MPKGITLSQILALRSRGKTAAAPAAATVTPVSPPAAEPQISEPEIKAAPIAAPPVMEELASLLGAPAQSPPVTPAKAPPQTKLPKAALPDDAFWADKNISLPRGKTSVHLRIDSDVLDWFKGEGKGHLTRMNAVLRAYMQAKKR